MLTKLSRNLFTVKRLPFAAVLGLAFIWADLAHAQQRQPDCFVISVGVDDYIKAGKLRGDVNDARNTSAAFIAQEGKLFGNVRTSTLVDGQATRSNIAAQMQSLANQGQAGDYVVVFLSGHGGVDKTTGRWYFLPVDYDPQIAQSVITDRELLEATDRFVLQGKRVMIIVDACFSGQLCLAAQPYMNRYLNSHGGGLAVMASSTASQMSNALGQYSAFAKAFSDSMAGEADANGDGTVTLEEIRRFSGKRTIDLLRKAGNNAQQDCVIVWSPSIPSDMACALPGNVLARRNTPANLRDSDFGRPSNVPSSWTVYTGSETLPGYGPLAFTCSVNGQVFMADAKGPSVGSWRQRGNEITLSFEGGRVLYTGVLEGNCLSGTASTPNTSWSWSVQVQSVGRLTTAMASRN